MSKNKMLTYEPFDYFRMLSVMPKTDLPFLSKIDLLFFLEPAQKLMMPTQNYLDLLQINIEEGKNELLIIYWVFPAFQGLEISVLI